MTNIELIRETYGKIYDCADDDNGVIDMMEDWLDEEGAYDMLMDILENEEASRYYTKHSLIHLAGLLEDILEEARYLIVNWR